MQSFAAMRPTTPNSAFARPAGPSSPPQTPTSPSFTFGMNARSNLRNGVYNFSRPIAVSKDDTQPSRSGAPFRYNQSIRPEDISPRSSSPSSASESSGSPPRSVTSESEHPQYVPSSAARRQSRVVAQGNFTIEEMRDSDSDIDLDSDDDISVIQPDHYEDAESDYAPIRSPAQMANDLDARMLADGLEKLDCNNHSDDREAWIKEQRKLRRKKRLSSGSIHKRTLSQSIGSDTDEEDLQQIDANEAGSSARRLRRKTGDRTSLIFDDPPQMILELDEPDSDDDAAPMQVAEPDVDVDVEEIGLHALPYYDGYELDSDISMEVDSDSDSDSDSD